MLPVLFFIITLSPVFAQTQSLISISTSESSYQSGDTVFISGKVTSIIADTPILIQIIVEGKFVDIAQILPAQDGTFTHTVIASGPLWIKEGQYTVRATYGQGNVAEVFFNFLTKKSTQETSKIFEVDAGSSGTFDIKYTIQGAAIKDIVVDSRIFAIVVLIETEDDGTLILDLPRKSFDAKKSNGADDTFIILIDGIEVPYEETSTTADSRTISIEFEEGDEDIEIIGTFVIPEFGTIAILILIVAIISIIALTRYKNASMGLIKNF